MNCLKPPASTPPWVPSVARSASTRGRSSRWVLCWGLACLAAATPLAAAAPLAAQAAGNKNVASRSRTASARPASPGLLDKLFSNWGDDESAAPVAPTRYAGVQPPRQAAGQPTPATPTPAANPQPASSSPTPAAPPRKTTPSYSAMSLRRVDNESSLLSELLQPADKAPHVAQRSALVAPAVPDDPESTTAPVPAATAAIRSAHASVPAPATASPVAASSRRTTARTATVDRTELQFSPKASEPAATQPFAQLDAVHDSATAITMPQADSAAAPPALFDEIAAALASTQLPRPDVPPCKPYLTLRRELHQRRLQPQRPTTRAVMLTQALSQPAGEPERIEPPAGEALPLANDPEEQELQAQLDRYGTLRSINDITLNIAPFTHRALDETQTDQQPPLQDKPGNAAALVLRQAGTVHYVSGPPRYPVSYRGLLSLADFCHRPLYFQEINLERYGTHHGIWQPALSAAHFFAVIPQLPYRMAIERPNVCYHYYHPYLAGRPAPWERELPPLRANAALWEAGVILGLVFLIP